MRFDHVGISVRNIEQSVSFYHDMFGMEKLCEPFPFGGEWYDSIMGVDNAQGRMCMIGGGNLQLELFEFANPAPTAKDANYPVSDHGYSHFGIVVDDIAAAHDRMKAAGVRFHLDNSP